MVIDIVSVCSFLILLSSICVYTQSFVCVGLAGQAVHLVVGVLVSYLYMYMKYNLMWGIFFMLNKCNIPATSQIWS